MCLNGRIYETLCVTATIDKIGTPPEGDADLKRFYAIIVHVLFLDS